MFQCMYVCIHVYLLHYSQYSGLTSYQGVSYIQPGTPSRTELMTGQGVMYQTHHPYMSQVSNK